MRSTTYLPLMLLGLAACAQQQAADVLPGERSSSATARSAVNAIGTPFYALGKGTACVVTTVFAVPVVGATEVMDRPADQDLQRQTYKTVGKVCGGRYYLSEERQTTTREDERQAAAAANPAPAEEQP